jgi:LysW-gamma-L-lysine carboxypeptidase
VKDERVLPRDDCVNLLTGLVAIPSPSRAEGAAVEFLTAWMADHGFDTRIDAAGNACGSRGSGPREILLLGHIDTFPGAIPYRVEDGVVHGRGAVDAKSPLAAFACAAAAVDPAPGWRVSVVGAVEEEAASSKGARQVVADRTDRAPAYCIIGEPSRWDRITLGYKGRMLADVTLKAPMAHSAGPDRLPAERGVALWRTVERLCETDNRERDASSPFDQLTPSLRAITSEDHGADGSVHLQLGFRLPLGQDPHELELEVLHTLAHAAIGESVDGLDVEETDHTHHEYRVTARGDHAVGLDLRCAFRGHERAYRGPKNTPLVRAFLRSLRERSANPRFVVKTGTADMNVVAPQWPDTPILAYGPGDSALDHTPEERVAIEEYLRVIDVLRGVLAQLMRG